MVMPAEETPAQHLIKGSDSPYLIGRIAGHHQVAAERHISLDDIYQYTP
jgi:hypothetical protein